MLSTGSNEVLGQSLRWCTGTGFGGTVAKHVPISSRKHLENGRGRAQGNAQQREPLASDGNRNALPAETGGEENYLQIQR